VAAPYLLIFLTQVLNMIRAFFLGAIFIPILMVMSGCRSGPPTDLIIRNDHRGLAEWYEQEAVRFRSEADEHRRMIQQYEDPLFQPSPKATKQELIAHCDTFIKYYSHAADEADALAKFHREQDKTIP
jgi:hypothetical protein